LFPSLPSQQAPARTGLAPADVRHYHGTPITWHHLWFSNIKMREFIEEHGLIGQDVALCSKCHETLGEQIVATYKALERFSEGARFLEEFGWAEEDRRSSRGPMRTRGPRGFRRGP